jgi:hypothetical protein
MAVKGPAGHLSLHRFLRNEAKSLILLATPAGIEPATFSLEDKNSSFPLATVAFRDIDFQMIFLSVYLHCCPVRCGRFYKIGLQHKGLLRVFFGGTLKSI